MLIVNLKRFGRQEYYRLTAPYDQELIEKIKNLSSEQRDWNMTEKYWGVTGIGLYNLILLYKGRTNDIKFEFDNDVDGKQRQAFNNIVTKHKNRVAKKLERLANLENLNKEILIFKKQLPDLLHTCDYSKYLKEGIKPMPHQIEGALFAKFLADKGLSTLLAMDLGTGKSLTSILAAMMDKTINKVLFIVPAGLRLNIQNEVEKFTNEFCYVVKAINDKKKGVYRLTKYKRNKGKEMDECKFIVLSYDYFSTKNFDANVKILNLGLDKAELLIFDEAHQISNKKSNRSINISKSFNGLIEKRIALTATPLKNNVTKFFPLLKMLKPDEFSNESKFFTNYCGMVYETDPVDGSYPGWKSIGSTNFEGLYQKIQTFTYRVKKSDVLKDLPPILINKILIEMTPAELKEYTQIEEGFTKVDWSKKAITAVDDEDSTSPMVILSRLRQYTATLKIQKALELIQELNDMGEKVILFDAFKKPIYALKALLGDESKIYSGDQSGDQKQWLVDQFQDKNSGLMNLLISLMAGNAGITLTEAANVIQTTLSYVPSENTQAYGRAHRIGQLKQVTVYILLIADTIDEEIYEILQEKEKVIKAVVDGEEHVDDSEVSVLSDIFSKMKNKYIK